MDHGYPSLGLSVLKTDRETVVSRLLFFPQSVCICQSVNQSVCQCFFFRLVIDWYIFLSVDRSVSLSRAPSDSLSCQSLSPPVCQSFCRSKLTSDPDKCHFDGGRLSVCLPLSVSQSVSVFSLVSLSLHTHVRLGECRFDGGAPSGR